MTRFDEDWQGSLVKKTVILLKESSMAPHEIFAETGLPYYWLKDMLAGNKSKGPSVNRIQYLYEYLSKKQLKV